MIEITNLYRDFVVLEEQRNTTDNTLHTQPYSCQIQKFSSWERKSKWAIANSEANEKPKFQEIWKREPAHKFLELFILYAIKSKKKSFWKISFHCDFNYILFVTWKRGSPVFSTPLPPSTPLNQSSQVEWIMGLAHCWCMKSFWQENNFSWKNWGYQICHRVSPMKTGKFVWRSNAKDYFYYEEFINRKAVEYRFILLTDVKAKGIHFVFQ